MSDESDLSDAQHEGTNPMSEENQFVGEIIEASTSEFTAESYTLHAPPRFGSFVKIPMDLGFAPEGEERTSNIEPADDDPFAFRSAAGSFGAQFDTAMGNGASGTPNTQQLTPNTLPPAIYAVVYSATTTSTETGKQPRAYWKDEDELAREQPQLAEWLLMTKFQAAIVGYAQGDSIRQYLPPLPPKIHTHVFECTADEIARLTDRMDFLRTLVGFRNAPCDEMVAACIRESFTARGGDMEFIVRAGKELASLLRDDYERLHAIVRRIR